MSFILKVNLQSSGSTRSCCGCRFKRHSCGETFSGELVCIHSAPRVGGYGAVWPPTWSASSPQRHTDACVCLWSREEEQRGGDTSGQVRCGCDRPLELPRERKRAFTCKEAQPASGSSQSSGCVSRTFTYWSLSTNQLPETRSRLPRGPSPRDDGGNRENASTTSLSLDLLLTSSRLCLFCFD